jgi:hypothetical protein
MASPPLVFFVLFVAFCSIFRGSLMVEKKAERLKAE